MFAQTLLLFMGLHVKNVYQLVGNGAAAFLI